MRRADADYDSAARRNHRAAGASRADDRGPRRLAPGDALWYDYDGERFNVTCFTTRVKVRNIRRNPRVSLVVLDTVGYGEPLIVRGTAELVEEGAQEATLRLAIRYEGETEGRAAAARLADKPRVIIRIKPDRILYGGYQAHVSPAAP